MSGYLIFRKHSGAAHTDSRGAASCQCHRACQHRRINQGFRYPQDTAVQAYQISFAALPIPYQPFTALRDG